MRQDTWVRRYLNAHSFVVRHCNLCSDAYYSDIAFAAHLVRDHDDRDLALLRFLGADSDGFRPDWLNDACKRAQAMPALR